MLSRYFTIFALLFFGVRFFASATTSADIKPLEKVLSTYAKQSTVEMEVTKTITSDVLGKKADAKGVLTLSKEKFRWETETPEKNLLVFDGSTFFSVQYPNKDLGGKIQVAKGKIAKNTKGQLLITVLTQPKLLVKHFTVTSSVSSGDETTLDLKPKSSEFEIEKLSMTVDVKKQKITKLSYIDDIGNRTALTFGPVYFNKTPLTKNLFKFIVPKDAQVTEL